MMMLRGWERGREGEGETEREREILAEKLQRTLIAGDVGGFLLSRRILKKVNKIIRQFSLIFNGEIFMVMYFSFSFCLFITHILPYFSFRFCNVWTIYLLFLRINWIYSFNSEAAISISKFPEICFINFPYNKIFEENALHPLKT